MPWISIQQAAIEIECSERTVRRRVRENRLASRVGEDGKTLVEIATAHQTPSRQMAATAAALTAQLKITTDQHANAMDAVAAAGMRAETRLAVVEKAARTNARTAILMAVAVVMCLAGAGIGFFVLTDGHRDALDMSRDIHAAEIAGLANDHQDVVLDLSRRIAGLNTGHADAITDLATDHADVDLALERRAATAHGVAEARADELTRAAERLETAIGDTQELSEHVKHLQAASRGERPDGTPILLAAEPE